jgi:hypothetical protein
MKDTLVVEILGGCLVNVHATKDLSGIIVYLIDWDNLNNQLDPDNPIYSLNELNRTDPATREIIYFNVKEGVFQIDYTQFPEAIW